MYHGFHLNRAVIIKDAVVFSVCDTLRRLLCVRMTLNMLEIFIFTALNKNKINDEFVICLFQLRRQEFYFFFHS